MQSKEMAERNRAYFQVSISVKMSLENCKRKAKMLTGGMREEGNKDINRQGYKDRGCLELE